MKQIPLLPLSLCTLLVATPSLFAANAYWDANGSTPGLGGDGEWNLQTPNWNSRADDSGTLSPWNNDTDDHAYFRGEGGTVNVTDAVRAGRIFFNSTGDYTLTGQTIRLLASGSSTPIQIDGLQTGGSITINNDLLYMASGNGDNVYSINNNGNGTTLTLNGTIGADFGGAALTGVKSFGFTGSGANNTTIINGTVGSLIKPEGSNATSRLQVNAVGENARVIINSDNSQTLTNSTSGQVVKGTVLLNHAKGLGDKAIQLGVSSTGATDTAAILTNQDGMIITNNVTLGGANSGAQLILGSNTTGTSSFTGTIGNGNSTQSLRLQAVNNGRVNFTNNITGGGTGKVIIQGQGVVAFTRLAGVSYSRDTDVDSGTLLFTNTSGSGTGVNNTVRVRAGAALGGTGTSTSMIIAEAATSRFFAGDLTGASVSTVNMHGGFTAEYGATFTFNIDGSSNDVIDFGTGTVIIGGTVYLDFGMINAGIEIGRAYTLLTGSGDWSGITASFATLGGYQLDTSYGDNGIYFDAATNSFSVMFANVPEPSTYALALGLGVAAVALLRRRHGQRHAQHHAQRHG